jgi:hypothetical protein
MLSLPSSYPAAACLNPHLAFAGSIVRTNLWLVLHHEGWEYTVLKRDLGGLEQDQNRTLLVSVSAPEQARLPPAAQCTRMQVSQLRQR